MDRHFILISEKYQGWYCGKCGKRLMMDVYNASKHASMCGFDEMDERIPLKEGEWGYRLEAEGGKLLLSIGRAELVLRPGFADRFSGIRWDILFRAAYPADRKDPEVLQNDTGMDLATWLALIRSGRCHRISRQTDAEMIRQVFPGVLGIHSLQMFTHIYRTKGYHFTRVLPPELEKKLLTYSREDLERAEEGKRAAAKACAGTKAQQAAEAPQQAGEQRLQADAQAQRADDAAQTARPAAADAPALQAGAPVPCTGAVRLDVRAYLYYREKTVLLRVVLGKGAKAVIFLFSRGYAACSRQVDLAKILRLPCSLDADSMEAVRVFDHAYPEYLLANYMERSHSILVPLLASDFHSGMELAAKAAVPALAESYDVLSRLEEDPSLYKNLKQLYGLPVPVLQALQRSQVSDEVLEHLRMAYIHNPAFVRFPRFSSSMLSLYLRATVSQGGREFRLFRDTRYSDRDLLRILRYLYDHPDEWQYYYDYLNACRQVGEYPYGLTPAIPIRQAHDMAVERIRTDQNLSAQKQFHSMVSSSAYLRLTTSDTTEGFEEDPYLILAPEKVEDLIQESASMHNCVRIYTEYVKRGITKIYFLRKKEDPLKSFGTIEVRSYCLYQAKGFANKPLPKPAQDFVRKWCLVNGLRILTRDLADQ